MDKWTVGPMDARLAIILEAERLERKAKERACALIMTRGAFAEAAKAVYNAELEQIAAEMRAQLDRLDVPRPDPPVEE